MRSDGIAAKSCPRSAIIAEAQDSNPSSTELRIFSHANLLKNHDRKTKNDIRFADFIKLF